MYTVQGLGVSNNMSMMSYMKNYPDRNKNQNFSDLS